MAAWGRVGWFPPLESARGLAARVGSGVGGGVGSGVGSAASLLFLFLDCRYRRLRKRSRIHPDNVSRRAAGRTAGKVEQCPEQQDMKGGNKD